MWYIGNIEDLRIRMNRLCLCHQYLFDNDNSFHYIISICKLKSEYICHNDLLSKFKCTFMSYNPKTTLIYIIYMYKNQRLGFNIHLNLHNQANTINILKSNGIHQYIVRNHFH